jgi:D-cysteine desulfhydrase
MKPLSLAQLPTPLTRLNRVSAQSDAEIWVKRDDLTGFGLSGNKIRKLRYLLADAQHKGFKRVVTCGGLQSNHCRATAIAARQLGMTPILLLRGEPPATPNGNFLIDRLVGADIHFCTPNQYRHERKERMEELANGVAYVIPEGGSNGLGALAFAEAWQELVDVPDFDVVVCAVGSGGTVAGLALGAPESTRVAGIAVCDDAAYFTAIVRQIAEDTPGNFKLRNWGIVEGYQGPAYAVATEPVWHTIRQVARLEGLLLDPVYTGKAFHGMLCEIEQGRMNGRILFWHTGGAFGLFGRGHEAVSPE